MQGTAPPVETSELSKRYGRLTALDQCTLAVQQGEVFGLLGPNGSGKTTLLRLLMGFLRPTSGRATISGRDCYRDSVALHAIVSYLPGDVRLFRNMKGRDMLSFYAKLRGRADATKSQQIAERLGPRPIPAGLANVHRHAPESSPWPPCSPSNRRF